MERLLLTLSCMLVHMPSTAMRYLPFRALITKKQKILLTSLYSFFLLIVGGLYYYIGEHNTIYFHKMMLFFSIVVVTAVNIVVIRGRWREHLFTAGLSSTFVSVAFFTVAFIVQHFVMPDKTIELISISSVGTFVLLIFLFKPLTDVIVKTVTPFLTIDAKGYWELIWYLPITAFLIGYLSVPLDTYNGSVYLFVSRIVLVIATLMMCNAVSKQSEQIKYKLSLEEQIMLQERYYHAQTERVMEARKLRHDLKHHLAAIRSFIDNNDRSGMLQYWESLNEAFSKNLVVPPYTGNPALDGVVYRYAFIANENNISFEFSGTIADLDINNADLCVLMGNALDNATTASLSAVGEKYVKVDLKTLNSRQIITITNSFDGQIHRSGDKYLSKKRNNERAGIGIISMKDICAKYGIEMDIRHDGTTFAVMFIIGIKETPQENS